MSEIKLPVEIAALRCLELSFTNIWSISVAEVSVIRVGVLI